jgi:predicted polyphosphate/ATP-dependent NAD kinase
MKIGFLVNPLAGIGGSVALKGSDGSDIVEQALSRGAIPQAGVRALAALQEVSVDDLPPGISILTAGGDMGERILAGTEPKNLGLPCEVVYTRSSDSLNDAQSRSTAEDTRNAISEFTRRGVDFIVFAGGDGTARDVLDAISINTVQTVPVLGIPAGVKIHSAVYAVSPKHAGELLNLILSGQPMSLVEAKVMDLDEQAFREGRVNAKCYGYLSVPVDDTRMQLIKQGGLNHHEIAVQEIAEEVVESMDDDVYYLIGSGSTTQEIMNQLSLDNTLLGVDIVFNGELIASDVDEHRILEVIADHPARIIVTVIGGQGHIFGRGNQQLGTRVIRRVINIGDHAANAAGEKENIIIVATNEKLRSLDKRPMIADTGDSRLDEQLAGLYHVITGYQQKTLYRLS